MAVERADRQGTSLDMVMRGILVLLVDEREARIATDGGARKTEVLLAEAGFSIGEIASLLGKNYETVKTTLRRARAKQGGGE